MSLKQHIELVQSISQTEQESRILRELMELTGGRIQDLMNYTSSNSKIKISPQYDFSGCSEEEQLELDQREVSNREILKEYLLGEGSTAVQYIPLPDWAKKYITSYSVKLKESNQYHLLIGVDGTYPIIREYIGPFSDIERGVTLTSRLDLHDLEIRYQSEYDIRRSNLTSALNDTDERINEVAQTGGSVTDSVHLEERRNSIIAALEEIPDKMLDQGVIYTGKRVVMATPESYREACESLGVEEGSSYAVGHRGYIRRLALYHPDKLPSEVLKYIPQEPSQDTGIRYMHAIMDNQGSMTNEEFKNKRKRMVVSDSFRNIELNDVIKFVEDALLKTGKHNGDRDYDCFSEAFLSGLRKKYIGDTRMISDKDGFTRDIWREYLMKEYDMTLEEYEAARASFQNKQDAWEKLYKEQLTTIGEVWSKNRDILMEAWEIFQAYKGMPWEQTKDLDIIYGPMHWGDKNDNTFGSSYHEAILFDRPDVMISHAFLRRGDFYVSFEGFLEEYNFYRDNSYIPPGLARLKVLLETKNNPDKEEIRTRAQELLDANDFQKSNSFNSLMEGIIKYPLEYWDGYQRYEYAPTLTFGKGYTWEYGMHEQDYDIPLWLLFAHIYSNTSGDIPYRIGQKFIGKYLPDASAHEIVQILEMMKERKSPEDIIGPWKDMYLSEINTLKMEHYSNTDILKFLLTEEINDPKKEEYETKKEPLQAKIRGCEELENIISQIYSGPDVLLYGCIGDRKYNPDSTRIGLEINRDGGLSLYFPIYEETERQGKLDVIYFSSKEVATMYLAMLESPILDDRGTATKKLDYSG